MSNKYYVVFVGRKPGVYDSWEDCKAQTEKFSGARFKSFKTIMDAVNAWAENVNETPMPERPDLAPKKGDILTPEVLKEMDEIYEAPEPPGWKPDSEYSPETQEVLKKYRGKHPLIPADD